MENQMMFQPEELPYEKLALLGISEEKLRSMPRELTVTLLEGRITPLFVANVTAEDGKVIAYCRLIPHGDSVHLGRVLVLPGHRAEKLGRKIVAFAVDYARAHFPQCSVYAQAQAYLERFYASFGFASQSAPYLEDNIPHIDMLLPAAQS